LVDASGNVDVIEIKKPMGKPIMLPARYRDHHLPMRDLVGAMGQVTHYLRYLNRWGLRGAASGGTRSIAQRPGPQCSACNTAGRPVRLECDVCRCLDSRSL